MASDMKLANEYLRVPKLSADGKGFVIWKERLELSIKAQGLYGHLDGTTVRPTVRATADVDR
jgi:gag-polypeptide of LTR copia-type